jgi:orotate phosphoribosyltransferase-like protein
MNPNLLCAAKDSHDHEDYEAYSDRIRRIDYSHLGTFLSPVDLREKLRLAEMALKTHTFDTLAFRGMSGAFLAPTLAVRLNKQMILVRKPEDSTHCRQDVEGYTEAKRYIIVDDFISSGETKQAIIQSVREFAPNANFVGMLQVKRIAVSELQDCLREGTPFPLQ